MNETTKKEEQFVLKILEAVQEYDNADFNIIESLRVILKMVLLQEEQEHQCPKSSKITKKSFVDE